MSCFHRYLFMNPNSEIYVVLVLLRQPKIYHISTNCLEHEILVSCKSDCTIIYNICIFILIWSFRHILLETETLLKEILKIYLSIAVVLNIFTCTGEV